MFSLSEAGKHNLEAIAEAFHRASLWHGPLYHERFIPWSGIGPSTVSEDEWKRFIDSESAKLPDDEWWEWEGPASTSPGWDASFLGRWYGTPEGMDTFLKLVDSTLGVLAEEDLKELEVRNVLQFDFGSAEGWVGTLHAWAFRYQMPLLQSDMTVWGRDDEERSKFFEDVNLWREVGFGERYPAYPVRWSLIDDVFTSSIAALRALLYPGLVITMNEPWPLVHFEPEARQAEESQATEAKEIPGSDGNRDDLHTRAGVTPDEKVDEPIASSANEIETDDSAHTVQQRNAIQGSVNGERPVHRIIHGPYGYEVVFAGDSTPVLTVRQTGLIRIARLIESNGTSFEPDELATYGGRKPRKYGRAATGVDNLEDAHGLSKQRTGIAGRDQKYNPEAIKERKKLRIELREWKYAFDKAVSNDIQLEIEEAREQIERIQKILNLSMASDQYGRAKDTVATTIRQTIADLQTHRPKMIGELEALLRQIDLTSPEVRFVSLPQQTKWVVERPI